MTKGLQNLPCGERLKKFGLFTLENKRLRRDLSTVFQYLKDGYKKERGSLFTRSKRYKLHWERFYSDIRTYIFLAGKAAQQAASNPGDLWTECVEDSFLTIDKLTNQPEEKCYWTRCSRIQMNS